MAPSIQAWEEAAKALTQPVPLDAPDGSDFSASAAAQRGRAVHLTPEDLRDVMVWRDSRRTVTDKETGEDAADHPRAVPTPARNPLGPGPARRPIPPSRCCRDGAGQGHRAAARAGGAVHPARGSHGGPFPGHALQHGRHPLRGPGQPAEPMAGP
ncbi:hypothetical protein QJS66_07335 [Kocuria rhizophila]|nr:hypothetical protein QJS66_07335 [Kocuria rhizophila]